MLPPKMKWTPLSTVTSQTVLYASGSKMQLGSVTKETKKKSNLLVFTAMSYIVEGVFEFDDLAAAKNYVEQVAKEEFAKMKVV